MLIVSVFCEGALALIFGLLFLDSCVNGFGRQGELNRLFDVTAQAVAPQPI
jgi:hypothetical protein